MDQVNVQRDGDSSRTVLDKHVIKHGLSQCQLTDTTSMGRHGAPRFNPTHYHDS